MSTYLELCRKVHLILRIGEETPGTQPETVTGQNSVLAEIVQWVNHSHDDICRSSKEWNFLRRDGEVTLPSGATQLAVPDIRTALPAYNKLLPFVGRNCAYIGMRDAASSQAGEIDVQYVPYEEWQGRYDVPPLPTGMPSFFTVHPNQNLMFDSIADRDYTLRLNYKANVIQLTGDNDVPMFDDDYHNAIVWWAILHYYCPSRDSSMELRNKADVELRRELTKLRNEQLPDFTL